jgi:outer membrane protein assembly factor BamB
MKLWSVVALSVFAGGVSQAADWPTYLGGNNSFSETSGVKLIDDMSQVKLLWSFEDKAMGFGKAVSSAASGYAKGTGLAYGGESSLIVAGGAVIHFYTTPTGDTIWQGGDAVADEFKPFHKISADETVIALDALTGAVRWKQVFKDKGLNTVPGKRGGFAVTPCAANGKVFAYGTTARLYCLDLKTGKVVWESALEPQHSTLEKFKAEGLKARTAKDPRGKGPYGMLQVVDDVLLVPGLAGIDTATGKELWRVSNATSGYNAPAPVRIGDRNYIACVNRTGELRLVEPKTGKVLWTHPLGSEHLTQPVFGKELLLAFASHPKITGDMFGKSKEPNSAGLLAAYRLTTTGAEQVWTVPEEFMTGLNLDAGPSRKVVARDGLVYFSANKRTATVAERGERRLLILREIDGKLLKEAEVAGWNPYLWGDRLITVTDIQHRPRGANPEIWQMYNADPADFRPLGERWHVNGNPPVHTATGGYEVPVLEPFADGIFYCRVWGGIRAYDLRRTAK